ncbi:hypothetical protein T484DRAFT_1763659 [Baffinella frigidus]|nr:hypothetical protein T484DRAFT_1763659 [Cryptophyta sp. CCMP2293]
MRRAAASVLSAVHASPAAPLGRAAGVWPAAFGPSLGRGFAKRAMKSTEPKPPRQRGPKPVYDIPEVTPPPARILASAIIQHLPAITPDVPPWAEAYYDLQQRVEDATSRIVPDDWDAKVGEAEALVAKESEVPMIFGERETESDRTNDRKSRDRALQRSKYLIVKRTTTEPGESDWGFPVAERLPGESMRDAKKRGMTALVGDKVHLFDVGFSPMAFIDRGAGGGKSGSFVCK